MPNVESRTRATAIAATILHRFWCSSLGLPACCHAFLVFRPCLGSSPETVAWHPVGVPGAVRRAGPHAMDRRPLIGNPPNACSVMRKLERTGCRQPAKRRQKNVPVAELPVARHSRFKVRGPPWGHAQNCVVPDARCGTYFFKSCLND